MTDFQRGNALEDLVDRQYSTFALIFPHLGLKVNDMPFFIYNISLWFNNEDKKGDKSRVKSSNLITRDIFVMKNENSNSKY